jgi:hypothetical protein
MLLFAGVSVGHVTVMADLRAMGLRSTLIGDPIAQHHSLLHPAALLESLFSSSHGDQSSCRYSHFLDCKRK